MEDRVNILIIGNGFDLAHELPTKYNNFLDFIKSVKEPDESIYSVFIDKLKINKKSVFSEIQSLT